VFTLDDVTVRPLEPEDAELLHTWGQDLELEMASGFGPILGRAAHRGRLLDRIENPRDDVITLGIETGGRLVGTIQLAFIDREERRAAMGIVLGERDTWGTGVAERAVRILLDVAFTHQGLERVYAECYAWNTRAHGLFRKVGFAPEGILRRHEIHAGERQDMHVFGILKEEFRARYDSIFPGVDPGE